MMRIRNATSKKEANANVNSSSNPNPKTKPNRRRNILQTSLSFIIISSAACLFFANFALHSHLESNNNTSQEESLLSFFFHSYYGYGSKPDSESESKPKSKSKSYGSEINYNYYSNTHTNSTNKISYNLIQNLRFNNTFDTFYKCDQSIRKATSPIFTQPSIFDFHIQIQTSLNILYMGDSVGIQFSQALQEATGADVGVDADVDADVDVNADFDDVNYDINLKSHNSIRKVLRYSWRDHEGVHIAGPVRGGGTVAGWRITGMLKESQRNNDYQMAPTSGGGWMEIDLKNVRRALAILSRPLEEKEKEEEVKDGLKLEPPPPSSSSSSICKNSMNVLRNITKAGRYLPPNTTAPVDPLQNCPEKNFDVAIFQVPFGWFTKPRSDAVTYNTIDETVQLLHSLFGAKVIILQTVPVGNNLQNFETELIAINNVIQNYTDTFQYKDGMNDYDDDEEEEKNKNKDEDEGKEKSENENEDNDKDDSIQAVLLMDMARFSIELFKHNAASLGLITLDPTNNNNNEDDEKFIIDQLNPLLQFRTGCCHYYFPQIIGFTCAQNVKNMTRHCTRTKYSMDGHHWCLDEVGGRVHGVTACLIKCGHDFPSMKEELEVCQTRCNEQYMSLRPIPFDEDGVLENY